MGRTSSFALRATEDKRRMTQKELKMRALSAHSSGFAGARPANAVACSCGVTAGE